MPFTVLFPARTSCKKWLTRGGNEIDDDDGSTTLSEDELMQEGVEIA